MLDYLAFLRAAPRRLSYGFLLAFFSSFGQTFFIAVFGGHIRADFDLTPGGFGTVYALATLTSAALMIQGGALLDRLPLRRFTAAIVLGLAAAALAMARIPEGSLILLFLALLMLRFFGQGLMSHVSATTMARDFGRNRGKAVSFASMGYAAGEALFPLIAVALLALAGWRDTWLIAAIFLALVVAPAMPLLLGSRARQDRDRAAAAGGASTSGEAGDWSRARVLRDPVFYALLPAFFTPSFMATGVFFHQVPIVDGKGWSLAIFASGFTTYAVATVAATLLGGRWVDAKTARAVLRVAFLPMTLGLAILAASDHWLALHAFMALSAATTGLYNAAQTALLAELYGLTHLGAIRALAASFMVFSTALSPPAMGLLLDAGLHIDTVLGLSAAFVAVIAAYLPATLAWIERRRFGLA